MSDTAQLPDDIRQQLGELLSAKLYEMQQDSHPGEIDWCYRDNVDEVIDAMLPALGALTGSAVAIPRNVEQARAMAVIAQTYLADYDTAPKAVAPAHWSSHWMASVPYPHARGMRVVGFVIKDEGIEIPREQLRKIIGDNIVTLAERG